MHTASASVNFRRIPHLDVRQGTGHSAAPRPAPGIGWNGHGGQEEPPSPLQLDSVREPVKGTVKDMEITVGVTGMTCEHCVNAVQEELMKVEDVQNVEVELREGLPSPVIITSSRELAPLEIESAVDEAGYVVV